jgi:FAD/FMN-containing dehydrogenase
MLSFEVFRQKFQGVAAVEGEDQYDIKRWSDLGSRNAKYVVYPTSAEDVARAIDFARAEKLDLAVRGGGMSPFGASSSEGLVIDLSRALNTVRVDANEKLAYVGGGATGNDLELEAIKYGELTLRNTRFWCRIRQ